MKYFVLLSPGHNRLYMDAATQAACAEAEVLIPNCTAESCVVGGVSYIVADLPQGANPQALWQLSLCHAIFGAEGELFRPVDFEDWRALPDSLNTILKYPGKTNEQFTRMLVNLAASASKKHGRILDPMCGQGTTLFEGAIRGMDAVGIEIYEQPVNRAVEYFVKYVENAKLKHRRIREKRRDGGKVIASVETVEYALTKNDWYADNKKSLKIFRCDGLMADKLLGKNSADMLVCDLPYGVQHGSANQGGKSRNAVPLLKNALPVWHRILPAGAGVALAYNTFTTPREDVISVLEGAGFTVDKDLSNGRLCHRVDQSILRDAVVARRI